MERTVSRRLLSWLGLLLMLALWGVGWVQAQTFTQTTQSPLLPQADSCIAWGDMNGDRYDDLIYSVGGLSVYLNDKSGNYLPSNQIPTNIELSMCAISLVNLDGNAFPDIYVTGWNPSQSQAETRIWLNSGDGTLTAAVTGNLPTPLLYASLAWADYNGDNRQDLLSCGLAGGQTLCEIWAQNAGLGFTLTKSIGMSLTGKGSVAWIKTVPSAPWSYMVSVGQFSTSAVFFMGSYSAESDKFISAVTLSFRGVIDGALIVADFDGNTTPDVLLVGNSGSAGSPVADGGLWLNTLGSFTETSSVTIPKFVNASVVAAKFDNDTLLDFAITGLQGVNKPNTLAFLYKGSSLVQLFADTAYTNYTNNAIISACDLLGNGIKSIAITGGSSGFFRNTNIPLTPNLPPCYNGFIETVSGVCICYEGYSGASCDAPACPVIRCLTPTFYGQCVSSPSECINVTSSDSGFLSTQSLIPYQLTFNWRTGVSADLFTLNSGTKRGTVDIPAGILQIGQASTLDLIRYPNVVLSIRSVNSDSVLNLTRYTPDQVFTVLVDLSLPPSIASVFTGSVTFTLDLDPSLNLTLSEICLAFLDFASWACADRNLQQPTATSVSGQTSHFTEFGALIAPEESSGDGGGSDDDLVVILTTTIIIPLALLFVVVVIVAVVVVGVLKGKWWDWRYGKRDVMVQLTNEDSL